MKKKYQDLVTQKDPTTFNVIFDKGLGLVRIEFNKEIRWVVLSPAVAIKLGNDLLTHTKEVLDSKKAMES